MDVQGTCILWGNKEFIGGIYIPLIQGLFVEPRNFKLMLTPWAKKMKGTSVKWGKHWQYYGYKQEEMRCVPQTT